MPRILIGDCRDSLRALPDRSVQCVVTSPPYWGLRDYGHDGQIGLEATPQEYVERLVEVFREVRRVLRDDGTLWLNLGDSYAANRSDQVPSTRGDPKHGVLKAKDLVGIPWRIAFALQADGWWLRQDIIWVKPNPMPESVRDRCTKSHEYLFLLTKSAHYYFDADAIKEPAISDHLPGNKLPAKGLQNDPKRHQTRAGLLAFHEKLRAQGGQPTRNKRDVWTIASQSYAGAHFAVMPPALVEPCILAGSRPGDVVLDPFGGSGTVGQVAAWHGRDAILCELNPAYASLIEERVRMPRVSKNRAKGSS